MRTQSHIHRHTISRQRLPYPKHWFLHGEYIAIDPRNDCPVNICIRIPDWSRGLHIKIREKEIPHAETYWNTFYLYHWLNLMGMGTYHCICPGLHHLFCNLNSLGQRFITIFLPPMWKNHHLVIVFFAIRISSTTLVISNGLIPGTFSSASFTCPNQGLSYIQYARNAMVIPSLLTKAGREASSRFIPAPQYWIPIAVHCCIVFRRPSTPKSNTWLLASDTTSNPNSFTLLKSSVRA